MSKILVTGGAGFIGSHVVEELLRSGHAVRVLDSLVTGKRSNLVPVLDAIEFIEGDIRDETLVRKSSHDVEAVVHLAAYTSAAESIANPAEVRSVNVDGTLMVLQAACDAGVSHIVGASSAAVYGQVATERRISERSPLQPINPYGESKLLNEQQRCEGSDQNMSTTWLRFFNVYGPRQLAAGSYASVIPRFIRSTITGAPITIYGDGSQERDFVYVTDVVRAIIDVLDARAEGIYNVGSGAGTSVAQLYQLLQQIHRASVTCTYAPPLRADIKFSVADVSMLCAKTGWAPRVRLEDGFKESYEWAAHEAVAIQ